MTIERGPLWFKTNERTVRSIFSDVVVGESQKADHPVRAGILTVAKVDRITGEWYVPGSAVMDWIERIDEGIVEDVIHNG